MYRSMDAAASTWLGGFIAGSSFLLSTYKSEFAFNIPYHLSAFTLALTGATIILTSIISSRFSSPNLAQQDELIIPVAQARCDSQERKNLSHTSSLLQQHSESEYSQVNRFWINFVLLVIGTCVRVEFARWVITHTQCARYNLTPLVPVALIAYEIFARPIGARNASNDSQHIGHYLSKVIHSRFRYMVPMAMMTMGAVYFYTSIPRPRSSFICAQASPYPISIPILQIAGTVLDTLILTLTYNLVFRGRSRSVMPSSKDLAAPGWALLVSSSAFAVVGLCVFKFLPFNRYWIREMPGIYILSAFKLASLIAFTSVCALQTLRRFELPPLLFLLMYFGVNMSSLLTVRTTKMGFPPVSRLAIMSSLILVNFGAWAYLWTERIYNARVEPQNPYKIRRLPRRLLSALLLVFLLQAFLWFSGPNIPRTFHPIDYLIASAESQHKVLIAQASESKTSFDAASIYHQRYGRDPPPRFDLWYNYAKLQSSVILDDYDSINEDLLPFWSISPSEIRHKVWEEISNPWNKIGGISVRKGKLEIMTELPVSHKWMLEGIIMMIHPYSRWLPDMDIPFNLNDESRSAVPFKELSRLREKGRDTFQSSKHKTRDFSVDRARNWREIPEEPNEETRFHDESFHHTFHTYGVIGCPPRSKARAENYWHYRYNCAACKGPHALGQFVSNWTSAADPCHQPDLVNLHGFYSSPADFKGTNDLMPVFSQSKAHGYQDIRYPSPWNYLDRAMYNPEGPEPSFAEKNPTLFWRGGTSEGMNKGAGLWKGMTRQRLVHMFNNATDADSPLVLLSTRPFTTSSSRPMQNIDRRQEPSHLQEPLEDPLPHYEYQYLTPATLHEHLSVDVHLVDTIDRCNDPDCGVQHFEFHPANVPPVPFQQHWRYKYLFDLDGAGFSGRFIPFLQSRSLPFKASLMREWWDGRVTAWKHFVPVDLRLDESWSLLAYFAGWKVEEGIDGWKGKGGTRWLMRPHEEEGERIARAGREWAGKVLRKEDMEVYLFRLLLEWGRLTDDKRDELGWSGDASQTTQ